MHPLSLRTRRISIELLAILIAALVAALPSLATAGSWSQLGEDIDGAAENDNLGKAVSLSSDGSRVAISASGNDDNGTNSGHVQILEWADGAWAPLGSPIEGEADYDSSGESVSLSSDGSRVAIGTSSNDGNGFSSGHVRIFVWDSGDWEQMGADIDGVASADYAGRSVSLSADGNRVAVPSDGNDDNGSLSGHVRIFVWDSGDWEQMGAAIEGEAGSDRFGTSVSLSSDGSRVAIGATGNDDNGTNSGHVQILEWADGDWEQMGAAIEGEAARDVSGSAVSLSSDGSRVAIGAWGNDGNGDSSGHVRIFAWDGTTWSQIGSDIDGAAESDNSSHSMSLSADGLRVAIGAYGNDDNGIGSGHVRVFEWESGDWSQLGPDIDGEDVGDYSGRAVSLSPDGSRVAIGALYNDGNGSNSGHVRVFELTLAECGNGVVEAGEACDGGGCCTGSCEIASAGSVCRASVDATCDTVETCDGASDTCPADAWAADGTVCDDGNAATGSDQCTDGVCEGANLCAGVTCSASDQCHNAGTCDPQTGLCSDPFAAAGASCGDTNADQCTAPDTCDGAGNCLDNHEAAGTSCDDDNPLTDGESCDVGACACAPGACDYNCGDDNLDAAEECDDGNNEDGDGCSSVCTSEEGCGNDQVELSETCDDGNNDGGDGCSSRCQIESPQSKAQQKCIVRCNTMVSRVAAAQNRENLACLKLASNDKLPEGQDFDACLEADNKGKMAKVAAKLKEVQEGKPDDPSKTKCPETPDFAYADDEDIFEAVVAEEIRFFRALLGADLAAAAVDTTDREQRELGICQTIVLKTSEKVLQRQLKEFRFCKKAVLKDKEDPAVSAEDLEEACFDAITTDAKDKIEKARLKLVDRIGKKCTESGYEVSDVLDGACGQDAATPAEFSECVVESGLCSSCRIFNAADGLEEDCDLFDDGEANDSCESGGASPSGAFVDGRGLGVF